MVVNSPLIRPAIYWRGVALGGVPLDSNDISQCCLLRISMKPIILTLDDLLLHRTSTGRPRRWTSNWSSNNPAIYVTVGLQFEKKKHKKKNRLKKHTHKKRIDVFLFS